ncbi:MAG: hypothetical protein C0614_14295 [Desulfuromonas sp.]|nr:MAG: hypothetical protein C0614_14295 [Desulfuromonas sp.]
MSPENFLSELYRRTAPVPAKGKYSNNFLTVDMKGISSTFSVMFEELLEKYRNKASIRIRGDVYYIEILNGVNIYRVYDKVFRDLVINSGEYSHH